MSSSFRRRGFCFGGVNYKVLIAFIEGLISNAQLSNHTTCNRSHAWVVPDTAADEFLDSLCSPYLFLRLDGAFAVITGLLIASRGDGVECRPNDFEDLLDLVGK